MTNRTIIFLLSSAVLMLGGFSVVGAPSASNSPAVESESSRLSPSTQLITPEIQQSIQKGLRFLEKRQLNSGKIGGSYPIAETSLATLAFLASGSTPSRGPYRKTIRRGTGYVFSQARGRNAYFASSSGKSRMHGHGFATLMLAEVYGCNALPTRLSHKKLKSKIESAIRTTRYAQTELGGWGYHPVPDDGDEASVTITQIQALRAARNAGLRVESETIDRAIDYVRKSHDGGGRFKYSLSQNRKRYSFALTAAAVSTLNYSGIYQDASPSNRNNQSVLINEGLAYMKENVPEPGERWYYYGMFYAAQAFYFSKHSNWVDWYEEYARELVDNQRNNGSWKSDISSVYSTSLALLILQIPQKSLPIFQK